MPKDNDVVVSGIGIFSSIGQNRESFWEGLISGTSGANRIQAFDPTGHISQVAAEIDDFDPARHLPSKRIRRMARFSQLASSSALQAAEDAGLDLEHSDRSRIGCCFGSAAGDYATLEVQHRTLLEKGPGKGNRIAVPKIIPNMSSANIGIDLGIHGPNMGFVTACASSSHAIGMAMQIIHSGLADVMFAGGAESTITPLVVDSYGSMGVLTKRNNDPRTASRPFDRDRDGFLIGEGAASLVLETFAHARKRGAEILAVLKGFGMTTDAYSIAIPEPEGKWAAAAIDGALHMAGINNDDVDYINAHGTSTSANDRIETLAIKRSFPGSAKSIPVSSTKSMIGHTLGAAGAIEAAATVLALRYGIIPPTINYQTPDPECDLDYVPNAAREIPIQTAISNSFGFGGQNGVLLFQKG